MALTFPLAGFDLESSGTDTETDRIVQVGLGAAEAPGDWSAFTKLVNPGIPIPEAATEVHHITDEMVADGIEEGLAARDTVHALYHYWHRGGIVVVANAVFDFTMLDRACRRGGFPGVEIRGPVLDTYILDKAIDRYRKGSRKLDATFRHYTGRELEGAHDAAADLYAAVTVARLIVEPTEDILRRVPGVRMVRSMDMRDLWRFQQRAYIEQKTSLYAYFDRNRIEYTPEPMDWPIRPWREEK
jgi:DNA polymerase-3 subunit epsilon